MARKNFRLTRPLAKQAARIIVAEGKPVSYAMEKVGYAPSSSRVPQSLTRNPLYQEEADRLQQALLKHTPKVFKRSAMVIKKAQKAKKTYFLPKTGEVIETTIDDFDIQLKAVAEVRHIFGRTMEDGKGGVNLNQIFNFLTSAEEDRQIPPSSEGKI